MGRRVLDREERADEVDAQDLLPELDGLLKQWHEPAADPRIGIDHIEPAERLDRVGNEAGDVGLRSRIGRDRDGVAAALPDVGDGLGDRSLVAIDRKDRGAMGCEQPCAGPPDAAARAGDDRAFAAQATIVDGSHVTHQSALS